MKKESKPRGEIFQMDEKTSAVFILEILGKPPEHIIATLKDLINGLEGEKGVTVKERNISDPKELESEKGIKGIYSAFAEIEADFDNTQTLIEIAFKYMPSNIEITSPDNFKLKSYDFNAILTEIIRKLHQYDEIARTTLIERKILEKRLLELVQKVKNQEINKLNIDQFLGIQRGEKQETTEKKDVEKKITKEKKQGKKSKTKKAGKTVKKKKAKTGEKQQE